MLDLNADGEIVGGSYFGDSSRIDMLWVPLRPKQGGEKGNERGNPHLKADEVLALWRDSVAPELRDKWVNIDVDDPAEGEADASKGLATVESQESESEEAPLETEAAPEDGVSEEAG